MGKLDSFPWYPYHRLPAEKYLLPTFLGRRTAVHQASIGCPFAAISAAWSRFPEPGEDGISRRGPSRFCVTWQPCTVLTQSSFTTTTFF